MTTIAPGQLVLDTETQRIWRIVGAFANDPSSGEWVIEMVEDPTRRRAVGDRSCVRKNWLQLRCVDYSTAVDPPKGNGVQVAVIFDENGEVVARRDFTTAEDVIAWLEDDLYPEQHGAWFGWNVENSVAAPDLTVKSVEGALVWENASS